MRCSSLTDPIREPVVAVDYESFYSDEYSLRKLSTFSYCNDPRFDAYLVAVYTPSFEWVGNPRDFNWELLRGKTLLAHNALFETCVTDRLQRDGVIPKGLPRFNWTDTADLAAYLLCKRALDVAVRELLGRTVDKSMRSNMKGLRFNELSTEDRERMLAYAANDAKECYALWLKYGHQWPESEQRISRMSREAGIRGMRLNTDALDKALSDIRVQLFEAERSIPWDFRDSGYKTPFAPSMLRAECMRAGIPYPASTAKNSEDFDKWMEEYGNKTAWAPLLGTWRSMNALQSKLETLAETRTTDGRYPFALKYFGGHTGRWSGDEGFNMQNMYKEAIFGIDLRSLFLPDEGCQLLVADYSAIEPRLLWWQVGDQRMLNLLRAGFDAYHAHAASTMGWPSDKPLKALYEAKDPDAVAIYPLAKARVLGLGYGCGYKKFHKLANQWGIPLTLAQAETAVYDYRDGNPLITGFWRARTEAAGMAARGKHSEYSVRMASGRAMKYFQPRFVPVKQDDGQIKEELLARDWLGDDYRRLYGGKITENLIQALARDVLADGWIRLDKAGLADRLHFTAHDEFVISTDGGEEARAEASRILSTPPEWAPDLPLKCVPKLFEAYTK